LIEISGENNEEEKEKNEKEHILWLERERLAQIEWKAKKEKEKRENMKKTSNLNKVNGILFLSQLLPLFNAHFYFQEKNFPVKKDSLRHLEDDHSPKRHKNVIETSSNSVITFTMNDIHREKCQYFLKTGVCKYGNFCNKTHIYEFGPNEPLTTLIIPNMYTHMLLSYELLQLNNDSGKFCKT
jgi:hypothetical protein